MSATSDALVFLAIGFVACAVAVEPAPGAPQDGAGGSGGSLSMPIDKPLEPNPCAPMLMWVDGQTIEVPVACVYYPGDRGDPPWEKTQEWQNWPTPAPRLDGF